MKDNLIYRRLKKRTMNRRVSAQTRRRIRRQFSHLRWMLADRFQSLGLAGFLALFRHHSLLPPFAPSFASQASQATTDLWILLTMARAPGRGWKLANLPSEDTGEYGRECTASPVQRIPIGGRYTHIAREDILRGCHPCMCRIFSAVGAKLANQIRCRPSRRVVVVWLEQPRKGPNLFAAARVSSPRHGKKLAGERAHPG